nr:type II toxin-antitoxin system MqsA family antitoxin [uncultured Ruminococcus sp.]
MKCVFCGGTEKTAVTEYVEKQGNYIIVIKNVPCMKCEQCGEEYFSTEVIKSIEKILDAIQRVASELTVTVIDYRQNSAA